MFGVLEVILRHDLVPGQNFGAGQRQIAFIVSLKVLDIPRLGAREPGRFISLGGSGSSRHSVGNDLLIWAWLRDAELLPEYCRPFAISAPSALQQRYSAARRLGQGCALALAVCDEAIAFGYPRERACFEQRGLCEPWLSAIGAVVNGGRWPQLLIRPETFRSLLRLGGVTKGYRAS
jgi:hypothetical protein